MIRKPARRRLFFSAIRRANSPVRVRSTLHRALLLCCVLFVFVLSCSQSSKVDEAQALIDSGQVRAGQALLREILDDDPDAPRANRLYGVSLLRTNEAGMAVWPLLHAYDLMGKDPEVGADLARALLSAGSSEEALRLADELLAQDPDSVLALKIKARAYSDSMQHEESIAVLDQLIEREPDALSHQSEKVQSLMVLRRVDEAQAGIDAIEEQARRRHEERKQGDEVDPLLIKMCLVRAVFAQEQGAMDLAMESFETCLERYPDSPEVLQKALSFLDQRGDSSRANQFARAAVESRPDSLALANIWTGRLVALGRRQEAEVFMLEALGEDPTPPELENLFHLYTHLEEYGKAADVMARIFEQKKAAGLPAPEPMVVFAYVDMLFEAGRIEESRKELERLDSPYRELVEGKLLLHAGDPESALRRIDEGLRVWPDLATARYLAGQAAEVVGDFDGAIEDYRSGVRQLRGASLTALPLARLHIAMGELADAAFVVKLMFDQPVRDPEVYEVAFELSLLSKDVSASRGVLSAWSKVLKEAPKAMLARAELATLQQGPAAGAEALDAYPIDVSQTEMIAILTRWAEYMADAGEIEQAFSRVEREIQKYPGAPGPHEARALLLVRAGRLEEALAALDRAEELGGERAEIWKMRGDVRSSLGDKQAALADYLIASQRDPESVLGRWERHEILLEQAGSGPGPAREELEALLRENPRNGRAMLQLARLELMVPDPDLERALALARRARRFRGGEPAVVQLIQVHMRRQEPRAALEVASAGLSNWPDSAPLHLGQATALASVGQIDKARQAYEKVLTNGDAQLRDQARLGLERLGASDSAPDGP